MTALTLRLEPGLARTLDQFCKETGHQKNGLIKSLIRRFLDQQKGPARGDTSPKSIQSLVGVVRLGGDAAREENYFEGSFQGRIELPHLSDRPVPQRTP